MQVTSKIFNKYNNTDFMSATGPVEIGMTNDYMFRIIFQENKFALKGLLESVLHLEPDTIIDLEIKNTIIPGQSITDKEYRMDVLVIMNDNTCINLEMQLKNLGNWQYRSLSYMCREFDSLDHGDDYDNVQPMYQIGFLDFTLFEDHPEFYAKYQMRNAKDGYLYTDIFNLIVVELNHEELATEEDIAYGMDKWVRLFKAKTWEELKMIAQENEYLSSAVESAYLSNNDKNILRVARDRDDFLRMQAAKDKKLASQAETIASQSETINSQTETINSQFETINSQTETINSQFETINSQTETINSQTETINSQTETISSLSQEISSLTDEVSYLKKLLDDNGIKYD